MDTGFRRRRPRSPSPDRGRGGLQPAGPITANEWTDAVETLQAQIAALNRTVADHATFIGKMRTELDQSTIPQIVQRIGGLEESVTQRFEHGWAAVGRKHDVLTAELRAFAAQLNQPPPRAPEPPPGMTSAPGDTAANFNVSTPPRDGRSDNPFHIGGHTGNVQHGEAPRTPTHPVANNNDFGFDSVSLSSSHGNNQFYPSNVTFGQRNERSMNVDDARDHATHRQSRTHHFTHHVHAPMWSSVPNEDFKISRKNISDLPIFDGDYEKYSHWKNKLTDHCADTNVYWRALLKHTQEATQPIDYYQLERMRYGKYNGWDLSLDLWNFISKRIGQTIYDRRSPLGQWR